MNKINDVIIYPLNDFNYQYTGPMFIRGKGSYLYDERGKKYLDAISGLWNVSFGHSNESINLEVSKQLESISYINLYSSCTPIVQQYANSLINELNGDFSRLIYTCSGSESIECAVKVARKYQKLRGNKNKNKIVIFDMSYHGTTYAAMSASGMDMGEANQYAPIVGGFVKLKAPFNPEGGTQLQQEEYNNLLLKDIEEVFAYKDEIAAVLIEPVIGSAGIIPVPDWYIAEIYELTRKHGILLIFDEVATGFGRTGNLFSYMNSEIKPDILCLSKGMNNGVVPMGATLINAQIESVFTENHQFIEHFSTQNGNPLACAAAKGVLDILTNSETLERVRNLGEGLTKKLSDKLFDLDMVRDIRSKGLMIGIDLIDDKGQPLSMNRLLEIQAKFVSRGLLVYPFVMEEVTSGFSLFPCFSITDREIDFIVNTLYKMLMRCC